MKSLKGKVIFFFSILMTVTILLIGSISYFISAKYIRDSVGNLAKNVAYSTSQEINLDYHKKVLNDIHNGERTEDILKTDEYRLMREQLYEAKKLTGIKYIYTIGKNKDGQFMYIVDGFHLDYKGDDISLPGHVETIDYEYMEQTYETKKLHMGQISYDETWGANITTYVPLMTENGEILGLLGVDFEAVKVYQLLEDLKILFVLIGVLILIFSIILCYFLASYLVNPLKKLTEYILTIKDEEFSQGIDIKGSREIEQLGIAFTNMLKKLNKTLENIKYVAEHDCLTGLYNRGFIEKMLKNMVEEDKKKFSLCLIDLDGFKQINDKFGHDIGDLVLKATAQKIQSVVSCRGFVGRLGGDEFVVCLTNYQNIEESRELYNDILNELNRPIFLNRGETELFCHASIGITYYPEHATSIEKLLKCADKAMYAAKKNGKNSIVIYDISA